MAWTLYYYTPSSAAAGIFVGLFAVSTLLHFYQFIRARTWFMIPFAIGGILETIGYIGRLLSALENPNYTTGPYAMQSALILIAPAFLAASIYMELGRIIRMLDAQKDSVIRLTWLTKIFVAGDVISFLMQAAGAGLMVQDMANPSNGEHIIIGGLFVQIAFFGFFLITAVVFEIRIAKHTTAKSVELDRVWHKHMRALHMSSILILIRSVVRVAEYLQGYDGYLMKNEVFIYIFDALLMFLAMVVLHITHPSEVNFLLGRGDKYFKRVLMICRGSAQEMEMRA